MNVMQTWNLLDRLRYIIILFEDNASEIQFSSREGKYTISFTQTVSATSFWRENHWNILQHLRKSVFVEFSHSIAGYRKRSLLIVSNYLLS